MKSLAKILLVACLFVASCYATEQTTTYTVKAGTCYAVEIGHPVSASSTWAPAWDSPRLDGFYYSYNPATPSGWTAGRADNYQWVQVSSSVPVAWTGIITQGRPDYPQWVTSYAVQYTSDGRTWTDVDGGADFKANSDQNSKVTNTFKAPVIATTLRIKPTAWYGHISMRFDATFQRLA